MRYIIYGAGAIGSIIGGHLRQMGASVVLVGPADHVRAIQRKGLTIRTRDGRFRVKVKSVATAAELKPFRTGDVVLLCAKTQQTLRCLAQLRTAGAPRIVGSPGTELEFAL